MRTFTQIPLSEFGNLLASFSFTRHIDAVHLHHTWRPNHRQYKGHDTILSMWRYHTEEKGWSDIAQHLTIAPDGALWLGRNWNQPPCSASGHNGNAVSGPFMIEVIGDFDTGQDRFEGKQREATLHVIHALQATANLPVESLRFHNQMSQKTCPGSSLERQAVLEDLRRLLTEPATRKGPSRKARTDGERPFGAEPLAVHGFMEALRSSPRGKVDPLDAELIEGQDDAIYNAMPVGTRSLRARGGGASDDITPDMLHDLRPHVINLNQGRFSKEGKFQTTEGDVDAIFEQHLPKWIKDLASQSQKVKLLFYAHGGLTSESAGLWIAHQQTAWWKANAIYPIYFVWETGFLETLKQLLSRSRELQRALPRGFSDLSDRAIEGICRTFGGDTIWSGMKRSAERASADQGGATYAARKLKAFLEKQGEQVELHAVGHSAGSIFHAHFLPMALNHKVPPFESMHLLAPAIRVDSFLQQFKPHLGSGVKHLTLFTMNKDLENDDNCFNIYRKSLLYLIHHGLEAERATPILGLEVSLRSNTELKEILGLDGTGSEIGEVIWSKTESPTGRSASLSMTHGGFDNDAATMNSVARRILGLKDSEPLPQEFPEGATRGLTESWSQRTEWPEELEFLSKSLPLFSTRASEAVSLSVSRGQAVTSAAIGPDGTGQGRKRSLSVGIDQYRTAPLAGCVADAQAWTQALRELGFDDQTLLLDNQATRSSILEALTNLVTTSAPGDLVVFQYAGHGTTLPDVNADEAGEDTPADDEALCPFDFADGRFVIDDDIAEVFQRLPDGVNLTCFIDCCHSGTISRFAVGGPGEARDASDRPRYLVATPEMKQAHRQFRLQAGRSRATGRRGPETMREVVFSACLSNEVAWESAGHGDFTTKAIGVLRAGIGGLSNEQFQEQVVRAFGAQPRQHPMLDCAPAARTSLLLRSPAIADSLAARPGRTSESDSRPSQQPAIQPVPGNGNLVVDAAVFAQLLKALTTLMEAKVK